MRKKSIIFAASFKEDLIYEEHQEFLHYCTY